MKNEEDRFMRFGDPGAVIIIDIDRLNDTNDTNDINGHRAGDDTIKLAACVIRNTIGGTDIAVRLGGDKFGIIVTNVLPAARQELARRLRAGFHDAGVRASIGHAPYTISAGFPGAVAAADEAMRAEKQRWRIAHSVTGCP
jgi:diguanylate cyclase (GGDEF)-like protein